MVSTRERILAAALELFAEQGFDGTSLQQIADRLGLTKAALYYHFRSKDDLLAELLIPVLDELEAIVEQPPDALLETYLDHMLAHRALISFVSRDLAVLSHPDFARRALGLQDRVAARLVGRVEPAGQAGEAEPGGQVTPTEQRAGEGDRLRGAIALGAINGALCSTAAVDDATLRAVTLEAVMAVLGAPVHG